MAEAWALVGDDVGIPIVAIDDGERAARRRPGRSSRAMPTGDDALPAVRRLGGRLRIPGFAELKRTRTGTAPHPERP